MAAVSGSTTRVAGGVALLSTPQPMAKPSRVRAERCSHALRRSLVEDVESGSWGGSSLNFAGQYRASDRRAERSVFEAWQRGRGQAGKTWWAAGPPI